MSGTPAEAWPLSELHARAAANLARQDVAAPPAGGRPQEAATPVEALAAELDALAGQHEQQATESRRNSTVESFHRGVAAGLTNAVGRLDHELAPAWDALAAENERLRAALERIRRENDGYDPGTNEHDTHHTAREALEARDA